MTRWLFAFAVAAGCALGASACTAPSCGKGTKQVQDANGNLTCVAADAIGPDPCTNDADAGTRIVGGKCVGTVECGANTMAVVLNDGTIQCVGTGSNGPPTCTGTPTAGHICISGQIRHFVDGMPIGMNESVSVQVFDPLAFLQNPSGAAPLVASMDIMGPNYVIPDIPLPSLGLIALAVEDPKGNPPASQMLTIGGTGLTGVSGTNYKLDGYAVPLAVVQQWQTETSIDFDGGGAFAAFFYCDASKAAQNDFTQYEMTPAAGVKLVQVVNNTAQPLANARYADPTRDVLSATDTATTMLGEAVTPQNGLGNFSGQGGTCGGNPVSKWEGLPGGSAPHVVFINRFHPSM